MERGYSCRQYGCPSVWLCIRLSRNVRLYTVNKQLHQEALIFVCTHLHWQVNVACQFSSKLSFSLTFIFKINDVNRVHWEVHMWLSRKLWQIEQTLKLPTHRKSHMGYQSAYSHLTLVHSKDQVQDHAQFDCEYLANGKKTFKHCCNGQIESHIRNISLTVTDRANIAIANKLNVAYDLSIDIFAFYLGPF